MLTSQVTGRPSRLGLAHQLDAGGADDAAQVHAAPVARISSKIVCSAMVSATTGTPDRPRRVASGAAGGHALAQVRSCGRSQTV